MRRRTVATWTWAALGAVVLAGCSPGRDPVVGVRLVHSQSYRELPPITHPVFDPVPFEWDIPRDGSGRAIPNSNVFIGLTQENFERFGLNIERMRAALLAYRARIDEVNRQRAEEREAAEAARRP